MTDLTPRDLLTGSKHLMKVSKRVPTSGMTVKYACDDFDTKITLKVSNAGTTWQVRGRGWSYTLVENRDQIALKGMTGLPADIDQTLTLARLAA